MCSHQARSYRAHFWPSAVKKRSFPGDLLAIYPKSALKTDRNLGLQICAQIQACVSGVSPEANYHGQIGFFFNCYNVEVKYFVLEIKRSLSRSEDMYYVERRLRGETTVSAASSLGTNFQNNLSAFFYLRSKCA